MRGIIHKITFNSDVSLVILLQNTGFGGILFVYYIQLESENKLGTWCFESQIVILFKKSCYNPSIIFSPEYGQIAHH